MNQRYTPYLGEIKTGVPVQDINRAPLQYPGASILSPIDKNKDIFYLKITLWIS